MELLEEIVNSMASPGKEQDEPGISFTKKHKVVRRMMGKYQKDREPGLRRFPLSKVGTIHLFKNSKD